MDPRHPIRMMRRCRKRNTLLTLIVTAVASSHCGQLSAETQVNPFFQASARRPAAEGASHQSASSQVTRHALGEIGVIDFDKVNRLLGDTTEPSSEKLESREARVPRRLPSVKSSADGSSADQRAFDQLGVEVPRRLPKGSSQNREQREAIPTRWLASMTSESCQSRALKHLEDAYREYSVHAWASAEASAWKALELTATAIDIGQDGNTSAEQISAVAELRKARTAIEEARDFLSAGASVDHDTLIGILASHQTPVFSTVGSVSTGSAAVSPTQAVDRYLDYARVTLMPIAALRVEAAQAMDLVAAIQLGRNEASMLPQETSLCMRRAALQGQPANGSLASRLGLQLADMGLDSEALLTLRHAVSMGSVPEAERALAAVLQRQGKSRESSRIAASELTAATAVAKQTRLPEVVQLSPSQFASISPAFNQVRSAPRTEMAGSTMVGVGGGESSAASPAVRTSETRTAGYRTHRSDPDGNTKPSGISRFIPTTLAGFRMPFASRSGTDSNRDTESNSIQEKIESTIDPVYHADEFRTHTSTDVKESTLKRTFGKIPQLW